MLPWHLETFPQRVRSDSYMSIPVVGGFISIESPNPSVVSDAGTDDTSCSGLALFVFEYWPPTHSA